MFETFTIFSAIAAAIFIEAMPFLVIGAGFVLPTCECGVVPIVRRLMHKGVPPFIAIVYMLAAPIVNPVVLASTYLAFRGELDHGVRPYRAGGSGGNNTWALCPMVAVGFRVPTEDWEKIEEGKWIMVTSRIKTIRFLSHYYGQILFTRPHGTRQIGDHKRPGFTGRINERKTPNK